MATVVVKRIAQAVRCAVKPTAGIVSGLVSDLTLSRTELIAENALLRQQLIVLRRCAKRPKIRRQERAVMVVLAALTRNWRDAVLFVKPDTILRWRRAGFIRGALLKLGIHVSKPTIQKYLRQVRRPQPWGRSWSTFLRNHAKEIWACDFKVGAGPRPATPEEMTKPRGPAALRSHPKPGSLRGLPELH